MQQRQNLLPPGEIADAAGADVDEVDDTLLAFQFSQAIVCLCGIGFAGITIDAYYVDPIIAELGQAYFGAVGESMIWTLVWIFLLIVSAVMGGLQVVVAIIFGLAAELEHGRRSCKRVYEIIMLLWIIVQLVVASGLLYGIDALDRATVSGNTGTGKTSVGGAVGAELGGMIDEILGFTGTVFNECCYNGNFSRQGALPPCTPDYFPNCTLPTKVASMAASLCACSDVKPAVYAGQVKAIRSSNLCSILSNATTVLSDSDVIPGTTYSLRLLVPHSVSLLPIVGDPETTYGCGLGFFRGQQWVQSKWFVQKFRPFYVALVILSVIQLLSLLAGACVVCRVRHDVTVPVSERKHGIRGMYDRVQRGSFMMPKPNFVRDGSASRLAGSIRNFNFAPSRRNMKMPPSPPTANGLAGTTTTTTTTMAAVHHHAPNPNNNNHHQHMQQARPDGGGGNHDLAHAAAPSTHHHHQHQHQHAGAPPPVPPPPHMAAFHVPHDGDAFSLQSTNPTFAGGGGV